MWLYLNTGLSSSINWGRKLLTEEADIVTAHGTSYFYFCMNNSNSMATTYYKPRGGTSSVHDGEVRHIFLG